MNNLITWTNYEQLLWATNFTKIKIIYRTRNGFIEIYKNDNFIGLETCIDHDDFKKYKHIFKAKIKYLKGVDKDGYLIIQLWNTRKLNKIYGIETQRRKRRN